MPKKGLGWFRFYVDWLDNPKVQMLDATLQQRYIMLLCLRSMGEIPGMPTKTIAWRLRIDPQDFEDSLAILKENGLWTGEDVPNWDTRQYVSDSSTERSRRSREAAKQQPSNARCNGDATLQQRPQSQTSEAEKISLSDVPTDQEIALDMNAEKMTHLLRGLILENDAKAKVPGPGSGQWRTWVGDMHKIQRIDGRGWDEIERMVRWCQGDAFWRGNILSPSKLRKQFTQLVNKSSVTRRVEGRNDRYA
jgi:hypothetical protein